MDIRHRTISILQVFFLSVCLTACSLLGIPESRRNGAAPALETPTGRTEIPPLFEPQSDVLIEPVNASSLVPSSAVIFEGASGFTWLPGNQGAAIASKDGVLIVPSNESAISIQSGTPLATQTIATTTPSLLITAKEVAIIAWVSGGDTVSILDTTVGTNDPSITQAEAPVTGLTLTPTGDQVAFATFDGQVIVQKPGDVQGIRSWETPTWLANLSYSADGSQLAGTDLANFTIYFQSVSTGEILRELEWLDSATSALYGAYLSPDWRQVAWVAQSVVQLMAVEDGKLGPLLVHQDVVRAVAWSPDSRLLATAAAATVNEGLVPVVQIWNSSNGDLLNTLVQPEAVQSLSFSPDGRQLAVLNTNGNLQMWSVGR
jgi:dipeptidyl aminopeptidase/acylaminoacyl peptidase